MSSKKASPSSRWSSEPLHGCIPCPRSSRSAATTRYSTLPGEVTMSSTQMSNEHATRIPTAAMVDMKLEVVVIPVSDVDRAKRFYGDLGWRLDADFAVGNEFRVVQFTPPGSPCSIHFGTGLTSAVPGSARGLYLIVSDIEAARAELVGRGVDVSEVFHRAGPGTAAAQRPGSAAAQLRLVRHVQRSGRQWLAIPGDQDASSWTRTQQQRRRDSYGASARGGGAPWRSTKQPLPSTTGRTGTPPTSSRASAARRPEEAAKDAALHMEGVRR